jgi:hypothetical protein
VAVAFSVSVSVRFRSVSVAVFRFRYIPKKHGKKGQKEKSFFKNFLRRFFAVLRRFCVWWYIYIVKWFKAVTSQF